MYYYMFKGLLISTSDSAASWPHFLIFKTFVLPPTKDLKHPKAPQAPDIFSCPVMENNALLHRNTSRQDKYKAALFCAAFLPEPCVGRGHFQHFHFLGASINGVDFNTSLKI